MSHKNISRIICFICWRCFKWFS